MAPMHRTSGFTGAAVRGDAVPADVITRGTAPVSFLLRESAGNDPARPGSAGSSSAPAASYELLRVAHARRAWFLAEMVVASIQAIGSIARRAYTRYREYREEKTTYDALSQLDDWTLRDLGFDRSELRSVAAEMTGTAEHTRQHVLSHLRP